MQKAPLKQRGLLGISAHFAISYEASSLYPANPFARQIS